MIDFLLSIWPSKPWEMMWGELRFLKDGKSESAWVDFADPMELLEAQEAIAKRDRLGWDAYYGVLPRTRKGGRSAEDTFPTVDVLWADIDAKAMPLVEMSGGNPKDEALHRLMEAAPAPSIVVDSGNGYHGYWLLRDAIPWGTAESIMRGIAEETGADTVYDRPRILRIPGTFNHKDPQNPRPVRIVKSDTLRRHRPGAFADYRDAGQAAVAPPTITRAQLLAYEGIEPDARGDKQMPGWLAQRIHDGAPQGQRSETAFSTIMWLIRYNYTDAEIEGLFEANPEGIGAKFYEKGGPGVPRAMKWLHHTIGRAHEVA